MDQCRFPETFTEKLLCIKTPVLTWNSKASPFADDKDKWDMHFHFCVRSEMHKCELKCKQCKETNAN